MTGLAGAVLVAAPPVRPVQPVHHLAAALPGLPPGEAPGYLSHQVCQQRGPGLIRFRGSSDCLVLVVSHKPIMIAAAAPLRGPLTCASNPTVTNYSCRISPWPGRPSAL